MTTEEFTVESTAKALVDARARYDRAITAFDAAKTEEKDALAAVEAAEERLQVAVDQVVERASLEAAK